jgi:2,3-bisphosphoglycerate-dependent phosphoglycerate mutase
MEIVLIRHGQPQWRRDGLVVSNPVLTELGHRQARIVAGVVAQERVDIVSCSPLVRARQTAAPLFEELQRDEHIEDWLEEHRDPDHDGKPAHAGAPRRCAVIPVEARGECASGAR